jgi:hypothetical protein
MKVTAQSTDQIVLLDGVDVRIWSATTESGIPCLLYVHRVRVEDGKHAEFAAELIAKETPSGT